MVGSIFLRGGLIISAKHDDIKHGCEFACFAKPLRERQRERERESERERDSERERERERHRERDIERICIGLVLAQNRIDRMVVIIVLARVRLCS